MQKILGLVSTILVFALLSYSNASAALIQQTDLGTIDSDNIKQIININVKDIFLDVYKFELSEHGYYNSGYSIVFASQKGVVSGFETALYKTTNGINYPLYRAVGEFSSVYRLFSSDIPLELGSGSYEFRISGFNVGAPINYSGSLAFSALSTVPLPAAAPMFGAALLGLAGLGYVAKRKTAAEAI